MTFASGELPQPKVPSTFAEGDAVLFLKQENGRLTERLRREIEGRRREVNKLRRIIDAFVEEYGNDILFDLHECDNRSCTKDNPCSDFIQGFY